MAEINLVQSEADVLIAMEKVKVDNTPWEFPIPGSGISIPLISVDKKENYFLDIYRGRIKLTKGRYQNRARQVVILVRLDFDGHPHRNPDGTEIPSPHLHVYKEGFADRWVIPAPGHIFTDINDRALTLEEFMRYCNITVPPNIVHDLFI